MADPNIDLAIEYLGGILAPEASEANYGVWVNAVGKNLRYVRATGTTGQRPADAPIGFTYYDTTLGKFVAWNGSAWVVSAVETFTDLTDTPGDYAGDAGKLVRVNGAETGLDFVEPFNNILSFAGLIDAPDNYAGAALKHVRVNAAANGLEFETPIEAFTSLTDTPSDYTGHASKLVQVAGSEDQLVFNFLPFLQLSDTPSSYAGTANRIVQVNGAASGIGFSTTKVPRAITFADPQLFDGGDLVCEVTTPGDLTLQPDNPLFHANVPVQTMTVIIPASVGVTSLTIHADYGQDGNPVADFDPAKGYLVFITRFAGVGGSTVRYAVSGKVIAS